MSILYSVFVSPSPSPPVSICPFSMSMSPFLPYRQDHLCDLSIFHQFSSVQLLSRVWLFATPWMQHARPPCPSPTPGVHPDSRPSSQWCHPAISSSVSPSPPASNPSQHQSFSNESTLCMSWPKYWSFSFSIIPSKEIPSQESSPTPQFKSINSSVLSLLHSPTLTSIHDHRQNHSLD